MVQTLKVEWRTAVPNTGLKPNSIYFIQPQGGNTPQVFISDNTGTNKWQINPTPDLSAFITSVNGIAGTNGNVNLDLSFANGILSLAGSGINVNLDARYVKDTDFQAYKSVTNSRLDSLEALMLEGVKTPQPFDASAHSTFPTQDRGFQYKVTVPGVVSGVPLEIGDMIIYDQTGNTPFVVQTNVDKATTTIRGLVRIATQIEVDNGLETEAVVVSATLHNKLVNYFNSRKASQVQVDAGTDDSTYVTPLTLQTKIQDALAQVHSHINLPVLNKFTEGPNGEIIYNGSAIYTVGAQEW